MQTIQAVHDEERKETTQKGRKNINTYNICTSGAYLIFLSFFRDLFEELQPITKTTQHYRHLGYESPQLIEDYLLGLDDTINAFDMDRDNTDSLRTLCPTSLIHKSPNLERIRIVDGPHPHQLKFISATGSECAINCSDLVDHTALTHNAGAILGTDVNKRVAAYNRKQTQLRTSNQRRGNLNVNQRRRKIKSKSRKVPLKKASAKVVKAKKLRSKEFHTVGTSVMPIQQLCTIMRSRIACLRRN